MKTPMKDPAEGQSPERVLLWFMASGLLLFAAVISLYTTIIRQPIGYLGLGLVTASQGLGLLTRGSRLAKFLSLVGLGLVIRAAALAVRSGELVQCIYWIAWSVTGILTGYRLMKRDGPGQSSGPTSGGSA